jgi:hypothetical protein
MHTSASLLLDIARVATAGTNLMVGRRRLRQANHFDSIARRSHLAEDPWVN